MNMSSIELFCCIGSMSVTTIWLQSDQYLPVSAHFRIMSSASSSLLFTILYRGIASISRVGRRHHSTTRLNYSRDISVAAAAEAAAAEMQKNNRVGSASIFLARPLSALSSSFEGRSNIQIIDTSSLSVLTTHKPIAIV